MCMSVKVGRICVGYKSEAYLCCENAPRMFWDPRRILDRFRLSFTIGRTEKSQKQCKALTSSPIQMPVRGQMAGPYSRAR